MPNKLIIDKSSLSDPTVLADCAVGDHKTLTVDAVVTRDDADIFEADITDIEYSDAGDADEADETYSQDTGTAPAKVGKAPAPPPMGGATGY